MVAGLTIPTLLGLAAADAINPCELAILIFVLIAILTRFPRERKRILKIGFTFIATIFVMYFIYGLILINLFSAISQLNTITTWLYRALGVLSLVLGGLNIKDFFVYGGGGMVTEVPRKWRPKMKRFIATITSPGGAIIIGIICALFLTPCTIGPYIIASAILAPLGVLATIPWLLLYNIIFILPMIAITLIIYFGFTTVDRVSGWRERNLRMLHLITGILLVVIGLALIFGWLV